MTPSALPQPRIAEIAVKMMLASHDCLPGSRDSMIQAGLLTYLRKRNPYRFPISSPSHAVLAVAVAY